MEVIFLKYIEEFISDMNNLTQQIYGLNVVIDMNIGDLCKTNVAILLDNQMSTAEGISLKMMEFEKKYRAGEIFEKG